MGYKGTSLLGDQKYRKKNMKFKKIDKTFEKILGSFKGQVLHAATIGFNHPRSEKKVEFKTKLPFKFRKLVDYLESVRIEGVSTNIPLLLEILKDEIFLGGKYDTDYLPNLLERRDVGALISTMESRAGDAGEMIDAKALEIEGTTEIKVVAPGSAIFYSTPSPSEPDYVQVGSRITTQDTLCQLEAMKIFTPLRLSDFNTESELYNPEGIFEVKRININSGQQINAGDLLFVVEECGG